MKLIFHMPEGKTEEFAIDKDLVIVGRGNTCDIVLPYEGFSRRHARIEIVDGEVFVTDLDSTNGVFIDGQRIPASERTQTKTFFNLQIGPAQQVEIIDDRGADFADQSSTPKKESLRSVGNDNSKTTRMNNKPSSIKKSEKASQKTVSSKRMNQSKSPPILFFVLALAGVVYYFMSQSPRDSETANHASSESSGPKTETSFISAANLQDMAKNKSCEADLQSWCLDAGIQSSRQEGVVVEGKSLIFFLNMSPSLAENYQNGFNFLSEKEKLEVLLLKRVFISALVRSLAKQTVFDSAQVIGGKVENGEFKVSAAIRIRRDVNLAGANKFFMIGLFDQILNQGKVEEISKISRLYEKLPLN